MSDESKLQIYAVFVLIPIFLMVLPFYYLFLALEWVVDLVEENI